MKYEVLVIRCHSTYLLQTLKQFLWISHLLLSLGQNYMFEWASFNACNPLLLFFFFFFFLAYLLTSSSGCLFFFFAFFCSLPPCMLYSSSHLYGYGYEYIYLFCFFLFVLIATDMDMQAINVSLA